MSNIHMIVSTHWEDYYTDIETFTEYVKGVAKRTPKTYNDLIKQFEKDTIKRIDAFLDTVEKVSEITGVIYTETEMTKPDGTYYGWTIYQTLYEAVLELINVDEYENMQAYYENDTLTLAFTHYENEEPMVDYFTLKERTFNGDIHEDKNIFMGYESAINTNTNTNKETLTC